MLTYQWLTASFLLMVSCIVSSAEIYQCRSDSGGIVFRDQPCLFQAYAGDSEAHVVWQEIRAISRLGESMNAIRGASVEIRAQCRAKEQELSGRIAALKPQIEQLAPRFSVLVEAYEALPQCVSCGQSATFHCRESNRLLQTAANELDMPKIGQ